MQINRIQDLVSRCPANYYQAAEGLYVCCLPGNGDGERFARLLGEVWEAIPENDRCVMRAQWAAFTAAPQLIYTSDWERGSSGDAIAQCDFMGSVLSWMSTILDRAPDAVVKEIIAHEFAHVYCFRQRPGHGEHSSDTANDEFEAEFTVGYWGFAGNEDDEQTPFTTWRLTIPDEEYHRWLDEGRQKDPVRGLT